MFKKLIFVIFIIGAPLNLSSQDLTNTEWLVCVEGEELAVFNFTQDTLYAKEAQSNEPEFALSVFSTNSDTLSIRDISLDEGCEDQTIVGLYTFTITNDSLDFILIDDDCEERADVMDNAVFKRLLSSSEKVPNPSFLVYPNPVITELNIQSYQSCRYTIYNAQGMLVLNGIKGESHTQSIDFSQLEKGAYFISLETEDHRILFSKILKL